MTLLVDTSAWSRFYRVDTPANDPIAGAVAQQLESRSAVTAGVVFLELMRGFTQPRGRATIETDLAAVPFVEPTREDYGGAADLSLTCRRSGVQLGAVDALIAQLCIANNVTLLTADGDFIHAARHIPLRVWSPT